MHPLFSLDATQVGQQGRPAVKSLPNPRPAAPPPRRPLMQRRHFVVAAVVGVGVAYFAQESMSLARIQAKNKGLVLAGKRAVVVGGTAGIGKGVAVRLAAAKVSVTVVGRSRERGEAVVQEMREAAGDGDAEFDFAPCDASLIRNARDLANEYAQRENSRVDYLVLTQGIATLQGYTPTEEGLDQKLSLHYFGRMAFIHEFLPLMARSEDPRVLTVLSAGVHSPYAGYKDDFFLERSYSLPNAANAAGMYSDIAVDSLSREHPGVTFIHAAPGVVNTNWGTDLPWLLRGLVRAFQPLTRSLYTCGEAMCEGLFSEEYRGGWRLMDKDGQLSPRPTGLHEEAREFVWEQTKAAVEERLRKAE